MTTLAADLTGPRQPGCWYWPIDPRRYDTTPGVRAAEAAAIVELGTGNLRRLARHDHAARGWHEIRRLLRPLDDAGAALESPRCSPSYAASRAGPRPGGGLRRLRIRR